MPFVAAAVGAVVGGISAAVGAVGSFIVGAGLRMLAVRALVGVGINLAMRAIVGKPKAGKTLTGEHQSVQTEPNTPRQVLVGQFATAGSYVFHTSYSVAGANDHVKIVFALADHECEAFLGGWWNDRRMTIDPVTGAVAEANVDGKDHLWVKVHLGGWNQDADADLVAKASGRWTVNDRGRGVCYAVVTARYSEKAHPGGLNGLFQILWELKGAKLYDRRLDGTAGGVGAHRIANAATHAWSDNAAVVLDNLLRGFRVEDTSDPDLESRARDVFYGLDLTSADLPADEWIAALNACDEEVETKAGPTEARYRAGGLISCGDEPETPIRDLLTAMAGEMLYAPGRWFPLPGVARTSERTITPDDMRIDVARRYRKSTPSGEAVNAVYGRFYDPAQYYRPVDLPPRLSEADEAADRGRKADTLELSLVPSQSQGQRVMEINRRRHRQQQTTTFALKPDQLDLEGGDAVTITTDYYSFQGRLYSGAVKTDDRDFLTPVVEVKEEGPDTYAWDAETDELDRPGVTPLSPVRPDGEPVTGLTVTPYAVSDPSGASRPGLAFAWDLIDDPAAFGVRIEYRLVGTTEAFSQDGGVDPDSEVQGLRVETGVAGAGTYEARGAILYRPVRTPVFSAWTGAPTDTSPVVSGDVSPTSPTVIDNLDLTLDVLLSRTVGVIVEEERRFEAEVDYRSRFGTLGTVDPITGQTQLSGGTIRFTPGGMYLDDAETRVGAGLSVSGDVARPLTVPIANSSNLLRRSSGGVYTGDLAATEGATWGVNVNSRPIELTDGRIGAGLASNGDVARALTVPIADSSNLLRRTAGGLYTGDLNATLGAAWGSTLTGRPTELTDGRITTALNASGVLQTNIPTSLADSSNILRRTGGGLFTGALAATAGATWGVDVGSRPTELTDGRVSAGLASNGDVARNLPSGILTGSNLVTRAGGGGVFTGDLNATAGATWGVNVGSIPTALSDGRVAAGLDASGDLARPITTSILNSSNVLRKTGGGLFTGALDATNDTTVNALSANLLSGAVKPAEAATFTGKGDLATLNTVGTSKIDPNAVTKGFRYDSAVELSLAGGSAMTTRTGLFSFAFTATGEEINIVGAFNVAIRHDQDNFRFFYVVERVGVDSILHDKFKADRKCRPIAGDGVIDGWQVFDFTDQPPAGPVTYSVRVWHSFTIGSPGGFAEWTHANRTMGPREFKR